MSISNIELRGNQALQFLLGVNTPQTNPEKIDMSTVNPVVEMSMQGFSNLHYSDRYMALAATGENLTGLQTKTVRILSQGNSGIPPFNQPQIVFTLGCHFVVFGCTFTVATNAAGAAALNNKNMTANVEMIMPDGTIIKKWRGQLLGDSTLQHYYDGMQRTEKINRQHICIVPSGCSLNIVIYIEDGTAFPAGTTLEWSIAGMNIPIGAPLPIGI